jgi:hypothetical protein
MFNKYNPNNIYFLEIHNMDKQKYSFNIIRDKLHYFDYIFENPSYNNKSILFI